MNIIDSIRAQIDKFEADYGSEPTVIRLGRTQSSALRAAAAEYDGGAVSAAERLGKPNFDGIEIQEVEVDDHLSVSAGHSD